MNRSLLVVIVLSVLALLVQAGNMLYRGQGDMNTCVDDGSIIDVHSGSNGKMFGTLLVVRGPNQPAPDGYDVKCKRNDGQIAYYQFDIPVVPVSAIVALAILLLVGFFGFGRRLLPQPC